jgi:molybdate transport system regulatory protein
MAKTIKTILKKKGNFKVNGSLWLECDTTCFFGPGPVELLKNIDETGSINKAAMKMKMSYKKALDLIHTLNEQAANPVVVAQTGGDNGGGSVITNEAKELIKYHMGLRKRFKTFLETETKKLAKLK